jgi:hypothetical protein
MKSFFVCTLFLCSFAASAQQPCATDILFWQKVAQNSMIMESNNKLEAEIAEQLKSINLSLYGNKTTEDTTTYDVPVVVHVVHDYGADFLSDDAIYEAFSHWQDVYLCRNADTSAVIAPFKPYIGNARIKLHLATKDPNGLPTKGVTRHHSYLNNNADDQSKLDWWPNTQYVNIWFINTFSASQTGTAAYSYYPSMGSWMPYYDGVISLASYLDVEKTIPHEIGHSMNLQHVWGNNNNAGVACGDDQVPDTPPTKGHLGGGCTAANLYDVTCSVGYQANGINYPDTNNSQNIMDYAYCEKMFTKGQVARMRAALTSSTASRNNLYSSTNLALTGALASMPDLSPTPEFSVEKAMLASDRSYFLCANSATKFTFTNRSWNDTITDVHWTFSNNADSATSNSTSFINNQFAQPGWVTVSITAKGNNTTAQTLTNTHAVYVADTNMLQPGGYTQNFSNANDHDNWPSFNYFDNTFLWEWYQGKGVGDNACMRYRSFDDRTSPLNQSGKPNGDWDDLFTPGFDLSGYKNGKLNLNFYTTGAYTQGATDSLQVLVSIDCGRIWKRIASITGTNLSDHVSSSGEYFPSTTTVWKPQTIAIPTNYLSYTKAFFKFRYFPTDNGNNLYLDKFSLTPFTTEVNDVAEDRCTIRVFPNPSSGKTQLVYKTGKDGMVRIHITDLTGNIIYNMLETQAPNTVFTQELDNIFPANGIYFISVSNDNQTATEKLLIMK